VFDLRTIKIVSGGQTGADRAALDFAIDRGLGHGGWCPRGRKAEDGPLPDRYELRETPSRKYAERTEWNVRDSDATVVFSIAAEPQGGTRLTLVLAERLAKPVLHLSREVLTPEIAATKVREFLGEHAVRTLNLAGPRASQEPEIAEFVANVLKLALRT
jgi:hypothetical protein